MFPKKHTLSNKEFSKVLNKGNTYQSKNFTVKVLENKKNYLRIGFVIGRKLTKKPVEKNYYKRLFRHVFKDTLKNRETGYDIVVIAKPQATERKQKELEDDARNIFKNNKIFSKNDK